MKPQLTSDDIRTMLVERNPRRWRNVSIDLMSHGHDVWLYLPSRAETNQTHFLAGRFWQGATRAFTDQTPEFERWLAGGARGKFFPSREGQ